MSRTRYANGEKADCTIHQGLGRAPFRACRGCAEPFIPTKAHLCYCADPLCRALACVKESRKSTRKERAPQATIDAYAPLVSAIGGDTHNTTLEEARGQHRARFQTGGGETKR